MEEKMPESEDMKEVIINGWKKGMKVACPECGKKVKDPYVCKEHGKFTVKVQMGMKPWRIQRR